MNDSKLITGPSEDDAITKPYLEIVVGFYDRKRFAPSDDHMDDFYMDRVTFWPGGNSSTIRSYFRDIDDLPSAFISALDKSRNKRATLRFELHGDAFKQMRRSFEDRAQYHNIITEKATQ